jgi:hypothetical protein
MSQKLKAGFDQALAALERRGLMLVHDRAFPSLTGLAIGEPVSGSWWAHPLSNDVYMIGQRLEHCADVVMTKLVSGKETYLHRRLWPQLVAIGMAREDWQLEGLPASARDLLAEVDRCESVRMDQFRGSVSRKQSNDDARLLAVRILAFADDVHTNSGAHARRLENWRNWANRHKLSLETLPDAAAARRQFENIVMAANAECSADAFLPWQRKRRNTRASAGG